MNSDVLAGAVLGFAIGYLYPWFFHYRGGADTVRTGSKPAQPSVQVVPLPSGVSATLVF